MTARGHATQEAAAVAPAVTAPATATAELLPLQGGASGDEAYPEVPARFLTDEQVQRFLETGVLVVPNVLSEEEIAEARAGLHSELAKYGVVRWPLSTACVDRAQQCFARSIDADSLASRSGPLRP